MPKTLIKNILRNTPSVGVSQLVVLILGLAKATIIPSAMGVSDYGYWQIYVFYTSFVGIFSLGFHDGLYLRYGGLASNKIYLPTLRKSLTIYSSTLFIFAVVFSLLYVYRSDSQSASIMVLVSWNIVIMGLLGVISQILQTTNQLKKYSIQNIPDKLFFFFSLLYLYSHNKVSYLSLATIDTLGKLGLLLVLLFIYRDIFWGQKVKFPIGLHEYWQNIKYGSKLMIANTFSMFIIGAGRLIIEYRGSIKDYAEYSFGFSISNLALFGITVLSIILYPTLKHLPESNYFKYYIATSRLTLLFNSALLMVYFPAVILIKTLYPQYVDVIPYLNVLFLSTFFQGKIQLINNTFLKLLRLESKMLTSSLLVLTITLLLSFFGYLILGDVASIAWVLVLVLCIQAITIERYLRKKMENSSLQWIWLELSTPLCFLLTTSLLSLLIAGLLYLSFLAVLYLYSRRHINSIFIE